MILIFIYLFIHFWQFDPQAPLHIWFTQKWKWQPRCDQKWFHSGNFTVMWVQRGSWDPTRLWRKNTGGASLSEPRLGLWWNLERGWNPVTGRMHQPPWALSSTIATFKSALKKSSHLFFCPKSCVVRFAEIMSETVAILSAVPGTGESHIKAAAPFLGVLSSEGGLVNIVGLRHIDATSRQTEVVKKNEPELNEIRKSQVF